MRCKVTRRFNYRMRPDEEQATILRKFCGARRWLYNKYVSLGNECFANKTKIKVPSYTEFFTEAPWLKECDSCALDSAKRDYKKALNAFFSNPKAGKPKKKKKKSSVPSYRTNNNQNAIWLKKNHLKLSKIKRPIKIEKHRNLPDGCRITSVTIREEVRDYFVSSITVEYEMNLPDEIVVPVNRVKGLDYSSPKFYVDAEGNSPEVMHEYRVNEDKLAFCQSRKDKKEYGSNNWWKDKNTVSKMHKDVANRRENFTNTLSKQLSDENDIVIVEDINLANMAGTLNLGKSTNDNGFGMFRDQLAYKLADNGGCLVKIPKFFASSKICNHCGYKNDELALDDREWACPDCGNLINRDSNAAINIKRVGIFGLIALGYITHVVDINGEKHDCGEMFKTYSGFPDYKAIFDTVTNNIIPLKTGVIAYVLSVAYSFISPDKKGINRYEPRAIKIPEYIGDIFIEQLKNHDNSE